MRVKLGTKAVISFFDSSSVVGAESFTVTVVDPAGDTVATEALSAIVTMPDVYLTEAVNFTSAGQYSLTYTYDETVVLTDTVQVGADPVSDFPRAEEVDLLVDNRIAGGVAETVQLVIFDSAGDEFLAAGEAAYDADKASYKRAATFTDSGQYFLAWTKDNGAGLQLPFLVEPILILTPSGSETCVFTVATLSGNNGNPHKSTTLVVSKEDGTHIANTITDVVGDASIDISPGSYIVSLIKSGTVFTNNNFQIDVLNTREVANDPKLFSASASEVQAFQLVTEALKPTYTAPASPADLCTLFATLYKMNGKPLSNAAIHVRLIQAPSLFDGVGVFDTNRVYKTDANGKVEFDLVQGIKIEVSIAPLSLRRIIDVPSGEDAEDKVNLLTLLSGADDVFDIISPTIPSAPRRTLG